MPESTVGMRCQHCDATVTIEVPEESLKAYIEGGVEVNVAFPSMSDADRELLIQARRKQDGLFHWYLCPTCWEHVL